MKPKTLTIAYWTSTIIFSLFLFADGLGGVLQLSEGKKSFILLGYPMYMLTIVGGAKICAGLAILQTKWKTIKEWAFAGYVIDCIGASASHTFSHQSLFFTILPFIFLAVMSLPYILWKKKIGEWK